MPIIKSAIKKMHVDAKKRQRNIAAMSRLRSAIKKAHTDKTFESVSNAYSILDKSVKTNLVKRNFANRQKASLSKLAKPVKIEVIKPVKVTKKVAPKATKAPHQKDFCEKKRLPPNYFSNRTY